MLVSLPIRFRRVFASAALAAIVCALAPADSAAQAGQPRFLGREEILLYGIGLRVEPAHQTVPKDIATIVSTYLQAPALPDGLPPFAPDAEVRATLRGPSFSTPQELRIRPNTPFNVPPLTVPGTHTIDDIRLVSGGEVLLRGAPESVTIDVIERLLVTQVTARPLSAAEIREKGIVFDASNFQAYNFSAAFAIQDQTVDISFPVLLPSLQGATDVQVGQATLPGIAAPPLPQLKTIIPDTLKLQTQIPNLTVVGFTLKVPGPIQGGNLVVPPIPGVIVIPGDIGFLNQFFSVMLMVGNVAPDGSGLFVSDLSAEIVLPLGRDATVGTPDDPLRMARTAQGESPRVRIVVQPGPDGRLGTSDDVGTLGPGETGHAEYLVEGRREGSHVVEMEISGTLNGLPVGPVQIRGRAAGAVLVRNPTFTLTFTHPEVVTAGEAYTLDVTVTNTSESPANFVQLTLYPRNVSGATIVGEPARQIESIPPGDSSTVTFDLVSRLTGKVTAATLDSDEKVAGRFELKSAVGELGVPLSPDSLVLPKEAGSLPAPLRAAALGLLGKAWAVATAPAAALPADLRRFSRKIVYDRAVEVAEAGFRYTLREPLPDSAAQLAMDFMGSNYARLAQIVKPADLAFERDNYEGFDELRRKSVRGDVFARAVADLLAEDLTTLGPAAFHASLAQEWSYRPPHVAVLASAVSGALPVQVEIVNAAGARVGALGENGKLLKEIPFSDALPFVDASGATTALLDVLATPEPGAYTVRLRRRGPPNAPYTISVVLPTGDGQLRQVVFASLSGDQVPSLPSAPGEPIALTFELWDGDTAVGGSPMSASSAGPLVDPPPSVLSVIQQKDADQLRCDEDTPGYPVGRVVAVLFSEEVTPASVQDRLKAEEITGFLPEANRAVGIALQAGRRIAFVALRDPIGPFVARQITIQGVADYRGQEMAPFTGPMETTVGPEGGVVGGRVLRADGTPVPYANVRLFYLLDCGLEPHWVGIASKSADAEGRYSWDYVLRSLTDKIVAVDVETDEFRPVPFNIQRNGQRLNVDIVFLGRGTFSGTTRAENGTTLPNTSVRITSLTDSSQYGALTDANGRFSVPRIPVGNIFVEAVNTTVKAQFAFAERIPFAGAAIDRDITLLDVEQRQTTVQHGTVRGHVLRTDGTTPAPNVPVFLWYAHLSQPGVLCPGNPPPVECAVAGGQTDAQGAFTFPDVPAGSLRVSTFDQDGLQQGEARLQLQANGNVELNVLLVGGLGTVQGRVLAPSGDPVSGALVGGGLSLVTTNSNGEFTLPDVPVGKREIVAVSELLESSGRVTIDLTRAGDTVHATIVLDPVGSVSGTVVQADGVTPVANAQVYLFKREGEGINVLGVAATNAQGGYRIDGIRPGEYTVSSFDAGFSDGNVAPVVLKYQGQVFRANITYRGSGGRVVGRVLDDDGVTPLRAMVSISGDRVVIAGGRVGVGFQYVNHFRITETDFTTGEYSLAGALVGPVTISAAGQFSPDPVTVQTTIPSPNASVEVNLLLQPTSQIRGVVLQPNGVQPVGQNVIVRYKSDAFKVICTTSSTTGEETCDSIPQGIQEEIVVTDENGRFWLPIVNAGPFTLTVEDPATGKAGQIKGAVRAGDTAEMTVRLLGLGELTVRVFGSDTTTPIPGARVTVRQVNEPRKEVVGTADTGGQILFVGADGFSEGDLVIEATDMRNGFTGRGTARIVSDGEQVTANVYLYDAVGTVYGQVYGPDGFSVVPNAEIVVSNNAGPLAFAITGVDGSYRIGYVPLGPVRVEAFEARTARRAAGSGQIDLAGQEVPINLTQASIGVIKGRVLESASRAPMKGWTVTLSQQSSSGLALGSQQTTTGVDGEYLFPGSSRGTFSLHARHAEVAGSASAAGTIALEGEVVDVPLLVRLIRPLAGTIAGVVLTSTGAPAGNLEIEICHPTRSCENPVTLTTDADGNFALPDVPLGRFKVTARSQVTHEAGSAQSELVFDGDIAAVRVVMGGVSEVRGTVERSNGAMAAGVRVELTGQPDPGCTGESCVVFTDGDGVFRFVDVPARTFSVNAVDPVNPAFKGAAGGALNPGQVTQLRIVLAPAFALSGRTMFPGSRVAAGIVADLVLAADRHLYAESAADGTFSFPAVPPGTYQLVFSDPVGSGAASRNVTIAGDLTLGDVLLDVAPPAVASTTPAGASTGVARDQAIRIVFSEPIRPGTINGDNVSLTGPSGTVVGTLDVTDNDTVVTLTPLAPLAPETRYSLRVRNVLDRVGKVMPADHVATFTTVDITPVTLVDASPSTGAGGVPIYSPVRLRFSETLDLTRFTGPPIAVTGPAGPVAGRIDYLFGNTVIVFTPNAPLAQDAAYTVAMQRAFDLAGNQQPAALEYQFTTTDRTPPQILSLTAANGGLVVENGVTSVTADVGTAHDVAIVDWYINDVLSNADRTAPFQLSFQANADYGMAGSQIQISAIATDTSGNRGDARSTVVTVTADQPPAIAILTPADGLAAHNGDHIVVSVRATDDLGVVRMGYQAQTGNPVDALTRVISPATADRTEQFAFNVPMTAAPGTVIPVQASAADTRGQVAQATINITVLDSTPPTVSITGATSGARVFPGQQTTVLVTAQDLGRISRVTFTAGGLVTSTETRTVDPAQPSIVTSFTVTVPVTAQPGQTLTLGASATDVAGNSATAAALVLPVGDTVAPTIQIAPQSGSFAAVPGRTVSVVATATDQVGLTRIDLTTSGAVSFSDSRQVTPPTGSAEIVFEIPVPASAVPGTVITVQATALDLSGNRSVPALLTLNVVQPVDVTLPASDIVAAGESHDLLVQVGQPAPAGGLRIDFASSNADVATATTFVTIPEGETSATFTVFGLSGGSAQIRASVGGIQPTSMTVTVQGGIVSGLVRDAFLNPVAGAQLTITSGFSQFDALTAADGSYRIDGVPGPQVDVRALDPATRLYGHATGTMARANGYTTINAILIPAAAVHGTVYLAGGTTPAGGGVRVDIYPRNSSEVLATTFTADDGTYDFPLVTLGEYRLEASDTSGNRGRASASLGQTGQQAAIDIVFLGTGTVTGTVLLAGTPVPNAQLTFNSWSIFGSAPQIVANANPDGTFTFSNVPVGSFSVVARDEATGQAGSASGTLQQHGQSQAITVHLANYATLAGQVYRSDGTTIVAGAQVSILGPVSRQTETDAEGRYQFEILPLGSYSITAQEPGTHGYAAATAQLQTHLATVTRDLSMLPQGRVLVTVTDAAGLPVGNAYVSIQATAGARIDSYSGSTLPDGTLLVEHVLAGALQLSARFGSLYGSATAVLAAGALLPVTVALEPTGSIAGTVFEPIGQTPAAGARVFVAGTSLNVTTAADGTFRLDGLRMGRYDLQVYDAANRLRARTDPGAAADDLVLASNGQIAQRDFTLVGLGTVTGRVFNPDASSAQDMSVQIWWNTPLLGGSRSARTNAGGFYTFEHVPTGAISAVAGDLTRQLYGERTGTLAQHGDTLQLDISLTSNAISLPRNLYDANNFLFDIQADGRTNTGGASFFYGNGGTEQGAFVMDVTADGSTVRFAGGEIPTIEDGNREVAVRQENVGGLSVTRKVFVPRNGYFARYLEVFRNPGAVPITVGVAMTGYIGGAGPLVARTSSGDATIDVTGATPDHWIVFGRADERGLGLLLDDPAATARTSQASFTPRANTFQTWGRFDYGWQTITVGPGETAALMHFVVQQATRDAAIASVQRLALMPPEALTGLSAEEIAAVRNFVLPDGGVSTVAPLPSVAGVVTGRVFNGDTTTAVPNATVRFRSAHPLFRQQLAVQADAEGRFTFTGQLADNGGSSVVPIAPFTVYATHPTTALDSPPANGDFEPQTTTAVRDIVFTNAGIVHGLVRRHNNTAITGGSVTISGAGGFSATAAIGSGSTYAIAGVPNGTYQLTAYVSHPQGSALTGTASVTVVAGQTFDVPITIEPTGTVAGVLRTAASAAVSNVAVSLTRGSSFSRATVTDSGGAFTFADVPAGDASVLATDARTTLQVSAPAAVVQDATTNVVLQFGAVAPVEVRVTFANGGAAAGVPVRLEYTMPVVGLVARYGTADASGIARFQNMRAGDFTAIASHPSNTSLTSQAAGVVSVEGETVIVPLTLPATGTVRVHVARGAGLAVAGSTVSLEQPGRTTRNAVTDAAGTATFVDSPTGAFTARATHPLNTNLFGTASGTIAADGSSVDVNVQLPPIGSVTGTVRMPDNSVVGGVQVALRSNSGAVNTLYAATDAQGVYLVNGVPAGSYTATVEDFTRGVYGTATGQIAVDGEVATTNISLVTNIVSLSTNLFDGNTFRFDIQRDGSLSDGTSDAYDGGLYLRLYAGGSNQRFSGANTGVVEEAGREVTIRQNAILGLDVVRKIYVPADGYFGRYLEIVRNPGTAPITVDLAIETNLGSDSGTQVVATSSGDQVLDASDLWIVSDDFSDGSGDPSLAHVLGGGNAVLPLSAASRSGDNLNYRWNGITVEPGQTIVVMHFAAQHRTRQQVRTAAERLVQLPPEAIAGLSLEEAGQILNFAVPPDLSSPLPPVQKPDLGTVTGRVLEYDGTTIVPSANVTFVSDNVLFGNRLTTNANASGVFTFTGAIRDTYTLTAVHPSTGIASPVMTGAFDPGQLTSARDITFGNTGAIIGTVRYQTGEPAASGSIQSPYQRALGAGGTYVLNGLAPGTYSVVAFVPNPQGDGLFASGQATVAAGQVTTLDLVLPATGEVAGVVTDGGGQPAAAVNVLLSGGSAYRSTQTDATGAYRFTLVPLGGFTVTATEPNSGVQVSAPTTVVQDQTSTVDLQLPAIGTVTGLARYPDSSPVAYASVTIEGTGFYMYGSTDVNGQYTFASVPAGRTATVTVSSPIFSSNVRRQATAIVTTHGEVVTANVDMPAVATLRVYTRRQDGTAIPYMSVYLRPFYYSYFQYWGSTNASGYLDATMPEGQVEYQSYFSGGYVQGRVTIAPADHNRTIEVTLREPLQGTVQGVIYAGDGATPVPYAYVEIRDPDGFVQNSFYTDVAGAYSANVRTQDGSFVVRAREASSAIYGEQTGTISATTPGATVNVTIPMSVLSGHVSYADATNVSYPNVFATQLGTDSVLRTFYATLTDVNGGYLLFGLEPGLPFELIAQDGQGLTARASAQIASITTALVLDVTMPETGTVEGIVRASNGARLADTWVSLTSPQLSSSSGVYTDSQGRFVFPRVPVGPFTLNTCDWSSSYAVCQSASGTVAAANQQVVLDLQMPGSGTVTVTLRDTTGAATPGSVSIEGLTNVFQGYWTSTSAAGTATFSGVPEGTFRVTGMANSGEVGMAEGTLIAGRALAVDLQVGNAILLGADLVGSDAFLYDIDCRGRVMDGGTADGLLYDAFDSANGLYLRGSQTPCASAAAVEENGRQFVLGPFNSFDNGDGLEPSPVRVTRKIYSPEAGRFARYLEILTNTTSQPQQVDVRVAGNYGASASTTQLVVAPAANGNTYAVLTDNFVPSPEQPTGTRPTVAHVFAGAGAPQTPVLQFANQNDSYWYQWNLSLAPGQTVALLHYTIQRTNGDLAGIQAQAEALAALTDAAALQALTAEDLAQIVNFATLPGGVPRRQGSVEGRVFAADGATPLASATVNLVDLANDRVLASARTDADGRYQFGSVYLAAAGAEVVAVSPFDANVSASTTVGFTSDGGALTGVNLTLAVSAIAGTVRRADLSPVAGPHVVAAPANGGVATYLASVALADGRYAIVGVPPGTYVLSVFDAVSGTGTTAQAIVPETPGTVTADLQLPQVAACATVPAGIAGFWRGDSTTADSVSSGADGTASGGVSYAAGVSDLAFNFNGVDGLLSIPIQTRLVTGAMTLQAWVAHTALLAEDQQIVYRARANAADGQDFGLMKVRIGGLDYFRFRMDLLGTAAMLTSTTVLEPNRFYHVAATYDGSTARLYIDGILEASQSNLGVRAPSAAPLLVGRASQPSYDAPCHCTVDELQVYGRALTPLEIHAAFAAGAASVCPDLVIATTSLPAAYVGQPYSAAIRVVGGVLPLSFAVTTGSPAPGVALLPDGTFSGTPTETGSYTFEVAVTDGAGATATASFTQECGTCLPSPSGLVGFWAADGNAADLLGMNNGSLSGASFTTGVSGQAFDFNGWSSTVQSPTPRLELSDTFTVEFWANPTATRPSTGEATAGISGTVGQRYAIAPEYRSTYGQANIGVSVGTNGISVFEHGPSYLPSLLVYDTTVSGWTHIAVVYQNRQPSLFINGALVRTGLTSSWQVFASKVLGDYAGYGYYQGALDEIGIYSRALDPAEIASIFNATVRPRCPGE